MVYVLVFHPRQWFGKIFSRGSTHTKHGRKSGTGKLILLYDNTYTHILTIDRSIFYIYQWGLLIFRINTLFSK